MRVGIFDYGAGNLFNISLALRRQGLDTEIVEEEDLTSPSDLDGLVLPGVGNFGPAISRVGRCREFMTDMLREAKPILGICLGMQLLFDSSEEAPADGLGILKGRVLRLPEFVKIPHMGWNQLKTMKDTSILEGIDHGSWVYFVHSYYPSTDNSIVVAETEYGLTFPSIVQSRELIGTQFHPEKSGEIGQTLLGNFERLMKR